VSGCRPGPRSHNLLGYRAGLLPGLPDMCARPPLFIERTSVGLDVHALSVAAAAIDGVTAYGTPFPDARTPTAEDTEAQMWAGTDLEEVPAHTDGDEMRDSSHHRARTKAPCPLEDSCILPSTRTR
jgi:hypothetical protein